MMLVNNKENCIVLYLKYIRNYVAMLISICAQTYFLAQQLRSKE